MKAAVIRRYGREDVLEVVEDHPRPSIAPNQVLLRVHAAGLNPLDWRIRSGQLRWLLGWRLPVVLGNDAAGEVVECGAEVTGFAPGDRVYCMLDAGPAPARSGFARSGAYAQFAVTRADTLARMPASLSFEQAAALPLAALTAYQALVHQAGLQAGQQVLINGASGGVGTLAVQIAGALGAPVTATCSERNMDLVSGLGVAAVIDYRATDIAALEQRFDLLYDVAAVLRFRPYRHLLTDDGMFIANVPNPATVLASRTYPLLRRLGMRRRYVHAWARPSGHDLAAISTLVDAGKLTPIIDQVYELDEIQAAHAHGARGAAGKLVVRI